MLRPKDVADLRANGIIQDSIAEKVYERHRRVGHDHQTALAETLNLRKVKCEGMDEKSLEALRSALFEVPGVWDREDE